MIYIAKIKRHWYSKSVKVDFIFRENAVDYCRKFIRQGCWAKMIERED